jgi:AraC-like DNA-binding protein
VWVLVKETLVAGDGFSVVDVRCGCDRSGWSEPEESAGYGIVFVRSGCFRRESDGVVALVDAASVYFEAPGRVQRVAHPHDGGDRCTVLELEEAFALSLLPGRPDLPVLPVFSTAHEDLAHRRLIATRDPLEAEEHVVSVATALFRRVAGLRLGGGRAATRKERRRVVDTAREALAVDPRLPLRDLAKLASVSPYHLSRIFVADTGEPISRYRNRIRTRLALDRISNGDRSLARVAADLGFADHGHMTRVIRAEAGAPPSWLRDLLRP